MAFLHFSWLNLMVMGWLSHLITKKKEKDVLSYCFLLEKKSLTRHSLASLTRIESHYCDLAAREAGKVGNLTFFTLIMGCELCL